MQVKVIYNKIPIGGLCTGEDIRIAKDCGVTPGNLGVYATTAEYAAAIPYTPPTEGPLKLWRDNGFIWDPSRQAAEYSVLRRNADGSVARRSVTAAQAAKLAAGANPAEIAGTGSPDDLMYILSPACWNFLATYWADFGSIPDFRMVTFDRAEAMRFSPGGPGAICDIPVSFRFASDCCPVFHPETGIPCFVKIDNYIKANPVPKSAQKPSGYQYPDAELADIAAGIVASGMTLAAKGAAIRKAAQ